MARSSMVEPAVHNREVVGSTPAGPTIDKIIQDVAELPDRTSPDDQPDMMMVTADELLTILINRLGPV